jgi:hypothetical protein
MSHPNLLRIYVLSQLHVHPSRRNLIQSSKFGETTYYWEVSKFRYICTLMHGC